MVSPDASGLSGSSQSSAGNASELPAGPVADELEVPRTEQLWLTSEQTRYRLEIALPHSYGKSGGPYPLVILLDTHYSFLIARNIADHLSERNHLPELILVGVGYEGAVDRASDDYRINRTRDYTRVFSPSGGYGAEAQKGSGGGPAFLAFLSDELIPELEARYPLSGRRALVGHSYGGLFGVFASLQDPAVFDHVISVSPSLWYADSWIFGLEEQVFASGRAQEGRLYLTVGSRERNGNIDMVSDLQRFGERLQSRGFPELSLRYEVLDNETHNSVFPRALSNGLRYVFEAP